MTDEKHTTMQEQLKEIFDNVNNWVTFAEAKNAAIIAFNVACISCIWDIEGITEIKILPYIWGLGIIVSTIMALISFVPQTGKGISDNEKQSDSDNLLFFKDIAKYSKKAYLKQIFKQYANLELSDSDIRKLEEDLADEITYNASIAIRKYKWFNRALAMDILMLVVLAIMIIIA